MTKDWPRLNLKDKEAIPGLVIGGALAFVAFGGEIATAAPSPPHQQAITRALQLIKFGTVVKKCGLQFAILGHRFLGLLDSGSTAGPKFMIDKQTAARVGIHNFRKSNRTQTVNFIESGIHHLPIYVPLTIPGVSTITTDVIIGGNNLVNPTIFLGNHAIAFHNNFVTFLPKGSPRIGVSVPYLKGNETTFNWRIGHHTLNCLLDTGDDFSMVSPKLAHNIGLFHYPKTAHYDNDADDFEFAYITPVSLLGTSIAFTVGSHCTIHTSTIYCTHKAISVSPSCMSC